MTVNLNPLEINEYILKAAQHKDNIFESFKKLCAIQKTHLDYVDFEWKYFQFYHGNRDLTIEKSPKNSSTVTFDDLPDEMIEDVVGKLNLISRLKCRKVCRKMLNANPEMLPKVSRFGVRVNEDNLELVFDQDDVDYKKNNNGVCIVRIPEKVSVTLTDDYVTRAIEDFGITLKIPKIRVKYFWVDIRRYNGSNEMFQLLKMNLTNRVFHAEDTFMEIKSYEEATEILAMFKPKALREVHMRKDDGAKPGDISELLAMAQFKLAKKMNIIQLMQFDASLIFDHFRHFRDFRIRVHSMSVDQIVRLRDMIISEFDSTHFKECIIHLDKRLTLPDIDSIRRAFGHPEDEKYNIVHRFEIPDSNGAYLEFEIRFGVIEVERKSGKKPNSGSTRFFNADSSDSD